MPKRFFWIKLKDNFFKQLAIKKLRKVAGGDTFCIIYLKMMLLSMNNEGKITFECNDGAEFAENLALEIDEEEDNVKLTLAFLQAQKLVEFIDSGEAFLPEVVDCIGSESESASRVRKHREKNTKTLQSNNDVTNSLQDGNDYVTYLSQTCAKNVTLEKEIEKEIDIENKSKSESSNKTTRTRSKKTDYASSVKLTDEEYSSLVGQYGEDMAKELIAILNNYKESTGKKYKSDAAAIRSWVVDAYYERNNKVVNKPGKKIGVLEAQQELERRLSNDNESNESDSSSIDPVWGVWAE